MVIYHHVRKMLNGVYVTLKKGEMGLAVLSDDELERILPIDNRKWKPHALYC